MRFLVDECTGPAVAEWLRSEGNEVFSVYEVARGASDDEVLRRACTENWILVTNDKDFGEKIFRERHPHHGVILLRLRNQRANAKIEALRALLAQHSDRLADAIVVVSEGHVRFAAM